MKNNVNRKNINVDKQNIIPLWNFKQEDDAILKLALYKGAIPFDITGQTIVLGAKRPNNTVVEQTDGVTINGNEIDINEGSPGQKCAAILAFILNSGENPLIIDQPEDDLDNSLIYSLVVRSIREMKKKRQIIIVTHNPNIPVLGDAEGIIILERNSEGKVSFRKDKKAGCIEEIEIRKGICEIMEGGPDAFRKREKKYMYV